MHDSRCIDYDQQYQLSFYMSYHMFSQTSIIYVGDLIHTFNSVDLQFGLYIFGLCRRFDAYVVTRLFQGFLNMLHRSVRTVTVMKSLFHILGLMGRKNYANILNLVPVWSFNLWS